MRYDEGAVLHGALGRPTEPAPSRTAPYDVRAEWAERYVAWYLTHTPRPRDLPSDVDAGHIYEVEFNSAVLDPQEYERDTQAELDEVVDTLH